MNSMIEDPREDPEDWWDCPKCGENTRICREENVTTGRECTDCNWSITIPEVRK